MVEFRVERISVDKLHRSHIEEILRKVGVFSKAEISVALELVDCCSRGKDDYHIFMAVDEASRVVGYTCFGRRPLTEGVYDLYWVAVDPEYQHKGVGHQLLNSLEDEVTRLGGRMILIETSSNSLYRKARMFYAKNGYIEIASINDFYKPRESLIVYQKKLCNHSEDDNSNN